MLDTVLQDTDGRFARLYNRENFIFPHGLTGNPLFELPNLVDLSIRMPDHRDTYWSNGTVVVNNPWEAGTTQRRSLQETITNIADNNSLVILKHTEQDPEYGPLLKTVLSKFVEFAGEQMRADVIVGEVLILISSPNRITPYHFDAETNFLLQVTGDKFFHVFDHEDRTLVTDEELEGYHTASISSAVYKEHRQGDATVYDLHAGFGLHIPVAAPHWVQNKNNVSVALSVNYELRSVERLVKIYRINRRLRRFGIKPSPPGASQFADRMKLMAASGLDKMRLLKKRAPSPAAYPVWTPPAA
jgi:hypothetical protein